MGQVVTQDWIGDISLMQQTVLLSAIRGADGVAKGHRCKLLIMWYRRCVVLSAFDNRLLGNPWCHGGVSFTGPSLDASPAFGSDYWGHSLIGPLKNVTDDFLKSRDDLPLHYFTHTMHAFQILGYKHPDPFVREYWLHVYVRMVHALHLWPETEEQMDKRLGDNEQGWKAREDHAGSCQT